MALKSLVATLGNGSENKVETRGLIMAQKKNAQIEALMDQLEGDVEDTPKKRGRPRKQE